MELTEHYLLPVPQQRAWEALNDTTILRASIPGCDSIEVDGEYAYALSMSASVGPVKARFKGRMRLTDVNAPYSYTIVFEGQGGASGFGKGNARVTLEPDGVAATKLSYAASAQIGGKLAQIGSRLVDGAARKIAGEFFRRFGEQLGGHGEAADVEEYQHTTAAASQAAAVATPGDEPQRRKRTWTAWISKS